jgi:hypothetical protein
MEGCTLITPKALWLESQVNVSNAKSLKIKRPFPLRIILPKRWRLQFHLLTEINLDSRLLLIDGNR